MQAKENVCFFELGFLYVALAILELTEICLPLISKCWDLGNQLRICVTVLASALLLLQGR